MNLIEIGQARRPSDRWEAGLCQISETPCGVVAWIQSIGAADWVDVWRIAFIDPQVRILPFRLSQHCHHRISKQKRKVVNW